MRSPIAVFLALGTVTASLWASPQKTAQSPPVQASVGYDAEARIPRGASGEVVLKAIAAEGYEVPFKIAGAPRHGTLGEPRRLSKGSVAIPYRHNGSRSGEDRFSFRFQTGPGKAWATRTARIQILEPEPRLKVSLDPMDFGETFAGNSVSRTLRIRNVGGGLLSGRLRAPHPWRIDGAMDFQIGEGSFQDVQIVFVPPEAGSFNESLLLESSTGKPATIPLSGSGAARIDIPADLSLAHLEAGGEGSLVVRNLTPAPLVFEIDAKPPLECASTWEVAGHATASLSVRLAKRHFSEKSAPLVLRDTQGEFVVKVLLPAPPAVMEWKEASPVEFGIVTAGRPRRLEFVLSNTGSQPATGIHLLAEGLSLAPDQAQEISIAPGESRTVVVDWTPAEGDSQASLTALHGGLSQSLLLRASAAPPAAEVPRPPDPTPQASPTPSLRVVTPGDRDALRRNNASDITYRNELVDGRVQTTIQWACQAIDKPRFQVEQWTSSVVSANPFQSRVSVPSEGDSIEPRWQPVGGEPVSSSSDARWSVKLEGLKSGYHKFRIATLRDDRSHFAEFTVWVPAAPAPGLPWWLGVLVIVPCAWILLRNRLG